MADHIFHREKISLREVQRQIEKGDRFLCPRCKSVLDIALNIEDSRRLKIWPGIWCPKNSAHVGISFNLAYDRGFESDLNEEADEERLDDKK